LLSTAAGAQFLLHCKFSDKNLFLTIFITIQIKPYWFTRTLKMPVWLITDIDVEFDNLRYHITTPGSENPGLEVGIPAILKLLNKYDINATFHIQEQADVRASVSSKYPVILEKISTFDQEIGIHVHSNRTSYEARKAEISPGIQRLRELGINIFSFKAGWYFTNTETIRVLEELRIKYDCSPFKNTSPGPVRWYNIPDSPYHPSYDDITKIGNAKLLIIPMTNIRLGIAVHKGMASELELMQKGVQLLISESEKIESPVIIYLSCHSWNFTPRNGKKRIRKEFIEIFSKFFSFLQQFQIESHDVMTTGQKWEASGAQPYFLNLPDLLGSYIPWYNPYRYFRLCKYVFSHLTKLKYTLFNKL